MADPEGLEDDLFADLYDADESTNRATSAVEAPKPAEPVPAAVPAQPVHESAVPSYDPSPVDTYPTHAAPQQDYNAGGYNGADHGQTQHPAVGHPVEHEEPRSGTGIKEDG
ncbi:RNA-binding protein [Penicillium cataractarum]|uniref:RNA-binding protein n=1 Tax=Penicillium cataractarum TaxID=2100454 RepID=A0A9W9RAS2_9EURO|nr:RNA-binding protein [Penicillium cataractarum]KAJ5355369.1 RNA-binding protein [Penicillium cataractarum]